MALLLVSFMALLMSLCVVAGIKMWSAQKADMATLRSRALSAKRAPAEMDLPTEAPVAMERVRDGLPETLTSGSNEARGLPGEITVAGTPPEAIKAKSESVDLLDAAVAGKEPISGLSASMDLPQTSSGAAKVRADPLAVGTFGTIPRYRKVPTDIEPRMLEMALRYLGPRLLLSLDVQRAMLKASVGYNESKGKRRSGSDELAELRMRRHMQELKTLIEQSSPNEDQFPLTVSLPGRGK